MKRFLTGLSIVLSLLGLGLIIYFAFNSSFYNGGSYVIDPELAGHFGSLVSGVVGALFTFVGFLLLYLTIYEQKKQFNIQQFESKLFELIRFHRENVSEISHIPPLSKSKDDEKQGRGVFIYMSRDLLKLFRIIKKYLSEQDVEIDEKTLIGITYTIFFFGVSKSAFRSTEDKLIRYYRLNAVLISGLIKKLRDIRTNYNSHIVYFGGHQSNLGFYFRHLYRTIKFIEDSKINPEEKINYSKILRGQLTNFEQAVFFFNSFSEMGKEWTEQEGRAKSLIEKYEMIKNISPELLGDIDMRRYYPDIDYEY